MAGRAYNDPDGHDRQHRDGAHDGGTGVLIQDNYLLTSAHVVWTYTGLRVVFPDGSEHTAAPVTGWDLIANLALIGPLETQVEPLALEAPDPQLADLLEMAAAFSGEEAESQ